MIDEYKRISTRGSSRFARQHAVARTTPSPAPKAQQPSSQSEAPAKPEPQVSENTGIPQNQKTEVRRELRSAENRELQQNEQIQRQTLKSEEDRMPVAKEEAKAASSRTAIIGVNLDVQA